VDLQLGDTASIEVDAFPDKVFTGKVVEVGFSPVGAGASDAVASATGSSTDQVTNYPVKIQILRRSYINDKDVMGSLPEHQSPFRPGMSGVVEIFTDRAENVLSVPIQAVTVDRDADDEEQRIVFAIGTENKAEKIQVRTGISDTEHLEIKSGLKAGQEIITGPYTLVTKKLKAGMEVRKTDADKESKEGAADETGDDD
jgi:HlyD family secretion protein